MKNGKVMQIGLTLFFLLMFNLFVFAQNQPQMSPAAQEANTLWQAQKWEDAAKAYESLTKTEPNNGQAWFRFGSALISLNKFQEAIAPLEKAAQIINGPMVHYTVGTAYAKSNNKDKAFEYLTKAASTGFAQYNRMKSDPLLESLREDARYNAALEGVERNARPCKYSPEAKQFDFWVGEWDVQISGQSVGTNIIERLEEGCLIMENWTGRGGSGKSMNFYNPVTKKWRQTYMSSNQVIWEMSGTYKDGVMNYEGEMMPPNSQPIMVRVKLYNLSTERIRHTQDNSTDGGKTWTNVWDSTYVRKKAAGNITK